MAGKQVEAEGPAKMEAAGARAPVTPGAAVVVARRAAEGALVAAVAAELGAGDETRAVSTPQP